MSSVLLSLKYVAEMALRVVALVLSVTPGAGRCGLSRITCFTGNAAMPPCYPLHAVDKEFMLTRVCT